MLVGGIGLGVGVTGAAGDRKRKRTSITDAEKRSLEAYFAVQARPTSERISQIAERLLLRKNVVRVWFCNQRQKQKRLRFAQTAGVQPSQAVATGILFDQLTLSNRLPHHKEMRISHSSTSIILSYRFALQLKKREPEAFSS